MELDAATAVHEALATTGPPASPDKQWSRMLVNAEGVPSDDAVRISAQRGDVPGLLLRSLVDQQQLTLLSP